MNRVFLTGKTKGAKFFFTPKGERIAVFSLNVEELDTVEVMYLDSEGKIGESRFKEKNIMVFGSLIKPDEENGKTLRVKAQKIEFMEE